jgi:amicyanin
MIYNVTFLLFRSNELIIPKQKIISSVYVHVYSKEVKMGKIWLISFLIIAVLASGCTYGPKTQTQPAAANTVEIKGYAFNPDTITIAKGTTVTWTNRDSVQHTVTGIGNDIDSPILSQGQTYSFTFNETGTFEYQCHIHPTMKGKVIVT